MKNAEQIKSVIDVVRSCDDVVLATFGENDYPDARHIMNAMNKDTDDLNLYFLTGRDTPKYKQIKQNPNACLYYFNPQTRYSVRLYGKIEFVNDMALKKQYWHDEYANYGYNGFDDPQFVLMRFVTNSYKYYVGYDKKIGTI